MAFCPECKKQISEAAVICPHCKGDIERYKDNLKAEKEKKEAERREKARLAAAEKMKAEELADRLICPDCATAVTLEDEICPKCGFPLDDEDERARIKMWHEIHRYKYKHRFFDRWFVPVIVGIITMSFALFLCTALAETREVFLHLLPIPIIIGVIVITRMVWPSFTKPNAIARKDNFEEYMLEHQNMAESIFADLVKKGEAHCPYCQKWLTQKSLIYQCMISPRKGIKPSQKYRVVKDIRCEHCGKLIGFPADRMREQFEQDRINRNLRRKHWGL